MDTIHTYTIEEATEDGILFDVRTILKLEIRDKSLFSHITTNLLQNHDYLALSGKPIIPRIFDLMNQSLIPIANTFPIANEFYETTIEDPNGEQVKIYIQLNELQRYTIMLPEDY